MRSARLQSFALTPRDVVPNGLQGLHSLGRLRHSTGSASLRPLRLKKPAGRTRSGVSIGQEAKPGRLCNYSYLYRLASIIQ